MVAAYSWQRCWGRRHWCWHWAELVPDHPSSDLAPHSEGPGPESRWCSCEPLRTNERSRRLIVKPIGTCFNTLYIFITVCNRTPHTFTTQLTNTEGGSQPVSVQLISEHCLSFSDVQYNCTLYTVTVHFKIMQVDILFMSFIIFLESPFTKKFDGYYFIFYFISM